MIAGDMNKASQMGCSNGRGAAREGFPEAETRQSKMRDSCGTAKSARDNDYNL